MMRISMKTDYGLIALKHIATQENGSLINAKEIATQQGLSDQPPAEDLLNLEGMDEALATQLARHGVATREDLAELAVDDMRDIADVDVARAGELIMEARKIWFEDEAEA